MDSVINLLPVLNAAGVPILAVALFLLIRAFRQQAEIYKGSSEECKQLVTSLQAEIQRLRLALESADLAYLKSMERVRELAERSGLVASALSEAARAAPSDHDVQHQVGEAVAMIAGLLSRLKLIEERVVIDRSRGAEEMLASFYESVSEIAEGKSIVLNPHARWALAVMLGGVIGGASLEHLVSQLRVEFLDIPRGPTRAQEPVFSTNDSALRRGPAESGRSGDDV